MSLRLVAGAAVFAGVVSLGSWAGAQDHAQHYVLDAYGGVHAGGGAPVITPATPYFGFDVAANIEYVAVGTSAAVGNGYIVLDKFGGVHYGERWQQIRRPAAHPTSASTRRAPSSFVTPHRE